MATIPAADLLTDPIPALPQARHIRKRYNISHLLQLQEHEDGSYTLQACGSKPVHIPREAAAQLHLALNYTFGL